MTEGFQLHTPLWMQTPRGAGLAQIYNSNGLEGDATWTVFLDNGQIFEFTNQEVCAHKNETIGRRNPERPPRIEAENDGRYMPLANDEKNK